MGKLIDITDRLPKRAAELLDEERKKRVVEALNKVYARMAQARAAQFEPLPPIGK